MGADGIKILGIDRDVMAAMEDEAHQAGLRIAHHVGVEETNAWDDIHFGTTSIEHWYGIPDAAIPGGVQNFPSSYNYLNEADRFRYAGRLWREADWDKLMKLFDSMIANGVAWNPTLEIYEASRDLQRAQNQPWFRDYLHPALEDFFRPNLENHGSYFLNWSTTDEAFWKENYQIWMKAVREFARRGGIVSIGEDAGYIYQMYGMQEINSSMPRCQEGGRYHVPAWVVPLPLNKEGDALAPGIGEGKVEGRAAFFDLSLDGRWGGVISGDRMEIDFVPCACGAATPSIRDNIVRYADLEGDDKIGCAGTIEAYVRGMS
jgi:hypothetical protein